MHASPRLASLGLLALALPLAPTAPRPAPAPEPGPAQGEGPRVVLESPEGEVRARPARGFTTADPRTEGGAWLVRYAGLAAPQAEGDPADAARLALVPGDRLLGRVEGGEAETLRLRLAGGPLLRVAVDAIADLRFPGRIPAAERERVAAPAEGDCLYRVQGAGLERLDGTLIELAEEGVRFQSLVGAKLVPWAEVAALFVEDLSFERPADDLERAPVVVDLADGSRLRGRLVELSGEGVRLLADFGQDLRLPAEIVSEVLVDDGRLAFLSDLPVAEAVEGSAFGDDLGMSWPHRRDLSVTGLPLRAGGRTYTRGLGVHSPSRLVWELDGSWRTLRGQVAVDDQVRRLAGGSVVFRIEVDGERAWESPVVRAGEPPLAIPPVALEGKKRLALVVDMAGQFTVGDRADWLRVLLVK